jgi:sRNA-binding protein
MMLAMRWALLALLCSCGPIAYVNEVTREAADAVDEAKAAQADKYAPYYWTRATQYLHKAREDAAHADFQGANRFGRLASEAAKKAAEEAMLASKKPAKDSGGVAPAKGDE